MKKSAIILSILFATGALQSRLCVAQTNLGDEQINVVKAYQPALSDAFKISDVPARDTAIGYTPDLKYNINQVQYPTVYTISPIKPLRIKDENIKKLYKGFIKAGYGTKNTPYGELFYNSLRSKEFDAGIHLNHYSSSGKIKNSGYPGMSESGAEVFGTRFFNSSLLRGDIGYTRSVYHYYGYNKPPDIFSKSETKHSFDDVNASVLYKSNDKTNSDIHYRANFSFYDFSDNRKVNESDMKLNGWIDKEFNGMKLGSEVEFDFMKYDNRSIDSESRTIVRINPRYINTFDNLKLEAGANVAIEINDLTKYHLYPHLRADYTLAQDVMSIFGQITGNLERQSYRELSHENPFLGMDFRLKNRNRKLDASVGLIVKPERQVALIGSIGLVRFTDDAFFRNLPPSGTLVVYDVMYDDNTMTVIHAEITYDQGDKTAWSLSADYTGNNLNATDKALFRPELEFAINGRYTLAEKMFLTTELAYVSSRNFINYSTNDFGTLKGFFDANLGVDYRYTKVLSVFLNLNNFTASKYSRWYNYPSYRFGVLAGLTYSF